MLKSLCRFHSGARTTDLEIKIHTIERAELPVVSPSEPAHVTLKFECFANRRDFCPYIVSALTWFLPSWYIPLHFCPVIFKHNVKWITDSDSDCRVRYRESWFARMWLLQSTGSLLSSNLLTSTSLLIVLLARMSFH